MIKWGWYQNDNVKSLFIHLLLTAAWKDGEWMGHEVKRGQLPTGLLSLKEQTGMSISRIRTALNKLKMTNEIAIKTTNHFSIITILKYDTYQIEVDDNDKQNDKQNDKPIANQSQTDDKPIATSEELKKVEEEILIASKKIKPLWKTSFEEYKIELSKQFEKLCEDTEWFKQREEYHPGLDISKSIQKAMDDFWFTEKGWKNKKGKGSLMIDLKATLNNALAQRFNQVWKLRN